MWLSRGQMIEAVDCRVIVDAHRDVPMVSKVVWDSRKVEPGCAFLAIKGQRVDGNDFVQQAIEQGASFVLATSPLPDSAKELAAQQGACVVQVDDHIRALQQLAACWRSQATARVVGVTGSTGKTTTKNMVAQVLAQQFQTVATAANQNNELGVPATVLESGPDTQMLVVEMGMRGFGQLQQLCEFVRPQVGLITNIGHAHEELLGSQDNIARAKSEMLAALPDHTGVAILNGDDPFTQALQRYADTQARGVQVVTYGLDPACDVHAVDVTFDGQGCPSFDIVFPDGMSGHVDLPMAGQHNVSNALAAAATGIVCGMSQDQVCRALHHVSGQAMRQEVVRTPGGLTVINDAYNANPDSMRAGLALLQMMECAGRRVAVLGDMGELGAAEVDAHRQVGRMAQQSDVDLLVCVGQLARHIAAGATDAGMPQGKVIECNDVASALQVLSGTVAAGDVVLVKASRFMELERVAKGLEDKC